MGTKPRSFVVFPSSLQILRAFYVFFLFLVHGLLRSCELGSHNQNRFSQESATTDEGKLVSLCVSLNVVECNAITMLYGHFFICASTRTIENISVQNLTFTPLDLSNA